MEIRSEAEINSGEIVFCGGVTIEVDLSFSINAGFASDVCLGFYIRGAGLAAIATRDGAIEGVFTTRSRFLVLAFSSATATRYLSSLARFRKTGSTTSNYIRSRRWRCSCSSESGCTDLDNVLELLNDDLFSSLWFIERRFFSGGGGGGGFICSLDSNLECDFTLSNVSSSRSLDLEGDNVGLIDLSLGGGTLESEVLTVLVGG